MKIFNMIMECSHKLREQNVEPKWIKISASMALKLLKELKLKKLPNKIYGMKVEVCNDAPLSEIYVRGADEW